MITLTKEWLLKTIAELEEERNATPGAVNEDAANALAAMKLALASLEAEPVGTFRNGPCGYSPSFHEDAVPLYTAPPSPVSVPDAMEMDDDFDSAFEHGKAVGWNAYRAAMLQSFGNSEQLNSPVIQDGWVMVPVEPTMEMMDEFDSIIDYGAEDSKEAWRRLIAAAPQQEVK